MASPALPPTQPPRRTPMRPAIEVWRKALDATGAFIRFRDKPEQKAVAVIEADRAELVAEIVAELRDQSDDNQDREWMGPLDIADYIEAKFGGRDETR